MQLIDSARDLLDTELTAMAGESYQRAYGAMVSLQMLAELEEVVLYKLVPEKRSSIRKMWWDRLQVRLLNCFLANLLKTFSRAVNELSRTGRK
jgi:FAT domain